MSTLAKCELWGVFDYEADMFFGMCALLTEGNPDYDTLPHEIRNAIVESAMLHARQLIDILLSRGRDSDDIKLANLLQNFKSTFLDELRTFYGNHKTPDCPCWTLNKRLAHATFHRGTSYDYSSLLNQLASLLQDLVTDVRNRRKQAPAG